MFWADGNAIGEKSAISDGHNSLAILNSGDDMVDQIGRAREVEFRIFSRGEFHLDDISTARSGRCRCSSEEGLR
jgi:hypothetical protein